LLSYDEERRNGPMVDSWMTLARNAALSAHRRILWDGLEIPKVPGPHADVGGDILLNMYTEGCSSLRDSRIHQGRAGGLDTVSGASPHPAGIVSKDPRMAPT
jgi:hypothetical protein